MYQNLNIQHTDIFLSIAILATMALSLAFCVWITKCKYVLQNTNNINITKIKQIGTKSQKRLANILENKKQSFFSFTIAETFSAIVFCICSFMIVRLCNSFILSILVVMICALILFFFTSMAISRAKNNKQNFLMLRGSSALKIISIVFKPLTFTIANKKNTENQINKNISNALNQAATPSGDQEMLRNILTFGDIEVKEIMTPRHEMVGVEKNENFEVLKNLIIQSNFSRIPVYEVTPDNIYGIIYVKDLLKYINENEDFYWQKLIKSINFVPENKKISDLLHEFQSGKIHMSAVCDEYGGICGLVTMEDILEEIVGEINDEFDNDETNNFVKLDDKNFVFEGKILLNDFYKITGIDDNFFDEIQGEAESLAGIILELRGEFPAKGETLAYKNLRFKIDQFDNRRIEKIRVHIGKNIKQ